MADNQKSRAFWLFVTLLTAHSMFASSVVVTLTPDPRIYIAADSLRIHHGKKDFVCKIRTLPFNNCSVGITGNASIAVRGSSSGFQLGFIDEAVAACKGPGTLRERADNFTKTVQARVSTFVNAMRQADPALYADSINGGDFLNAAFVGTQNGRLAVFIRGFRLDSHGRAWPITDEGLDIGATFFLGANRAILAYTDTHTDWAKGDIVAALQKLIGIEANDRPDIVGGDISILSVDSKGNTNWIEPGECSDPNSRARKKPNSKKPRLVN